MADVIEVPTSLPGLVLRELTAADAGAYFELVDRNRDHIDQRGDHPFERAATRADIDGYFANPWDRNVRFGVRLDGELVGRVDLNPIDPPRWVLGYWIGGALTGRGIATSAADAAISFAAATLGTTEVYAGVTHGNEPSVAVLRRLGFAHIQDLPDRSRWRLALVPDPPPPVMA